MTSEKGQLRSMAVLLLKSVPVVLQLLNAVSANGPVDVVLISGLAFCLAKLQSEGKDYRR